MTVSTASSFYVDQVRDVTVMCFTVRYLTEQNYDVVSEELLEFVSLVAADRPIRIVAELSAISEVDELGLAMLQAFSDSIEGAGGTLVLCRVQTGVMAAIRRMGLRCEFSRTCGEAIWSF